MIVQTFMLNKQPQENREAVKWAGAVTLVTQDAKAEGLRGGV